MKKQKIISLILVAALLFTNADMAIAARILEDRAEDLRRPSTLAACAP